MDTFRILTLNVHKGYSLWNSRFVLHEIRDAIREDDPDIVFLQEVVGSRLRREADREGLTEESQHVFLADRVWEHAVYSPSARRANGHHGNAVLSTFSILSSRYLNLSTHRIEQRGMLHYRIALTNDTILHTVCVHLGLWKAARSRQMDWITAYLAERIPAGEPVILAGDFNDWTGRLTARIRHGAGMYEAFASSHGRHARTFPSIRPFLRLDRVYLRGLSVTSTTVHTRGVWGKLSDHLPLSVDVRVATP